MTHDDLFQDLLRTVRDAYRANPEMEAFRPFPDDIRRQAVAPNYCPCSDVFRDDSALSSQKHPDLQTAIRAAGEVAHWRATYKDTDIGRDFMDRFGCYCIIGENGPFSSDVLRLYMVYMPAHLHYPWHHHPAEEIYLVVTGSAKFMRHDQPDETLSEGQTSFHESNQPHAMETSTDPVLCLVAWRNQFQTPPVLTDWLRPGQQGNVPTG